MSEKVLKKNKNKWCQLKHHVSLKKCKLLYSVREVPFPCFVAVMK